MNKLAVYSVVVTLILVCGLLFLGAVYMKINVEEKAYQQGVIDGEINMANIQTTNGVIFYLDKNKTMQSIGLNEVCGKFQ